MNPKGRHAKNKARIANYDKMLSEDVNAKEAVLEMPIPNGPRLGNNVIDAEHVGKSFGEKLLYDDLNFKLPPAGIVGIIGPNGAGKTTIFKMIMGELASDNGKFEVGETVKIGYVDQTHKDIHPDKTVFEVVSNGLELIEIAPGIDLDRDIKQVVAFSFSVSPQLSIMNPKIFNAAKLNLDSTSPWKN